MTNYDVIRVERKTAEYTFNKFICAKKEHGIEKKALVETTEFQKSNIFIFMCVCVCPSWK